MMIISDGTHAEFECALSLDKHFLRQPIHMTCGHAICKQCLSNNANTQLLKCNICSQINKTDLNEFNESIIANKAFLTIIDQLATILNNQAAKSIEIFKSLLN